MGLWSYWKQMPRQCRSLDRCSLSKSPWCRDCTHETVLAVEREAPDFVCYLVTHVRFGLCLCMFAVAEAILVMVRYNCRAHLLWHLKEFYVCELVSQIY